MSERSKTEQSKTERTGGMTLTAFDAALDRHGAALGHWPATERQAAEALLLADPEARRRLQAAEQVDRALVALMQVPPSASLAPMRRRIAAEPALAWRRIAAWSSVALAASLAIGFVAGATLPIADTQDDDAAGQVFLAVNTSESGDWL